jgi:hypothetical protein
MISSCGLEEMAKTPEGDSARWRPRRRSRGGSSSAPRKAKPFAEINSGVYKNTKIKTFSVATSAERRLKHRPAESEAICGKEQRNSAKQHKFLFLHAVIENEIDRDSCLLTHRYNHFLPQHFGELASCCI